MTIVVTRAAQRELDEAVAYYDEQRPGLGERLYNEFRSAISRIMQHPLACPKAVRDARKCNIRKFPYAIIYRFRDGIVTIIAFMHLHRKPGYWRARLS
jgi:toxin ParE2